MNYIIRKKFKDCETVEHITTIMWPVTYKGIVNDEFLNSLKNTEKEIIKRAKDQFANSKKEKYVLEVTNKLSEKIGSENIV